MNQSQPFTQLSAELRQYNENEKEDDHDCWNCGHHQDRAHRSREGRHRTSKGPRIQEEQLRLDL